MGTVRVASEDDAEAIAGIYAPYVLETAISFEETPPSPEEMADRIRATLAFHPFLVFAEDNGVIGYAYAGPHRAREAYRWSVDVTIYAARGMQRRGVGRTLYGMLLASLRQQGIHSAFAGIALPNAASVALHEAMGFTHIGVYREVGFKHGAWHDVGWWRLPLGAGLPKSDPTPFDQRMLGLQAR